jgi:hypothetical protein
MHKEHIVKHDARCGTMTDQKEIMYHFSTQDLNIDQVLNRQIIGFVHHTHM